LAPEPELSIEKRKIWQSHVIILYSSVGITYGFLGPFPNPSVNLEKFKKVFASYDTVKPIFS
jgi:hypothetical protein